MLNKLPLSFTVTWIVNSVAVRVMISAIEFPYAFLKNKGYLNFDIIINQHPQSSYTGWDYKPRPAYRQSVLVESKALVICNQARYIASMIKNFRDKWLENFFVEGEKNKKIPSTINERLLRKLQIFDDSTCYADLQSPPGNNFEKLTGKFKDRYSIRINDQWKLIFQWDDDRGEAMDVYLDNHSYR